MVNVSNLLKTAAIVGVAGLGFAGVTSAPVSADTVETRCDSYGDCYRVRCNDFHEDCYRVGYYGSSYYRHRRYVCDSSGDDCHYVYDDDYYRPGLGFDFHF